MGKIIDSEEAHDADSDVAPSMRSSLIDNIETNHTQHEVKEVTNSSSKDIPINEDTPILWPNLALSESAGQRQKSHFDLKDETIKFLKNNGLNIESEIGHGSYGKVFGAFSKEVNDGVAIKIMDTKKFSQYFLNKFLSREIDLMKSMTPHDNIIKFHKTFKDNGLFYIVMERAINGDLFNYILKRRFIPEYQSCDWFKQIINGVEHIHSIGFAHRDLKCENLLLDLNHQIKITDFGFCCHIKKQKTRTRASSPTPLLPASRQLSNHSIENLSNTFCGSFIYASPELLRNQPYNPVKADIWSCGVILYVMLFGSYPYDDHELQRFIHNKGYSITLPEYPQILDQCKHLLKRIFVGEDYRISIEDIKQCSWFSKEWNENYKKCTDVKEYFETLGIPRQETETFDFLGIPRQETETFDFVADKSNNDNKKPNFQHSDSGSLFKGINQLKNNNKHNNSKS